MVTTHYIDAKPFRETRNSPDGPATEEELKKNPNEKFKTLIETRGEKGYIACYPSKGYSIFNGDFKHIPEITTEERDILLSCARALNHYNAPSSIVAEKANSKNTILHYRGMYTLNVETINNYFKSTVGHWGKMLYKLRKQTVEPVFGIIKEVMGFRRFSLRGQGKSLAGVDPGPREL